MWFREPSAFRPEGRPTRQRQGCLKAEADLLYARPLPSMGVLALKKEMLECLEQTARQVPREKRTSRLTTEETSPSRDMLPFLFRQKFRKNRMCWLMAWHAAQAMCSLAPQE